MKIIVAKNSGFCFGVKRAVKIALDAAKNGQVYTLGALIHNPPMVQKMGKKGIVVIDDFKKIDNEIVIIPSHGISPEVLKKIKPRVKKIIDATCPFVKKARDEAIKLSRMYEQLIIVGDKKHPEIRGILPFLQGNVIVVKDKSELQNKSIGSCGIIAQTTMSENIFQQVVLKASKRSNEIKVINTICDATRKRQTSTLKLLKDVDIMIIIGGHNSANTRQLLELCIKNKKRAYQVEDEDELKKEWFKNFQKVGITAGASTPPWMIKKIREKIQSF
ncbi:MAG: 4-hydroxy-3-methylbut-2-enyl diphosphate reductase [Candidatus Omnitrophica bacterium]|nr:4-hydroxy-3-methylbut-2-enyl diphosphate reductase [Candidatus Omnitrophota bacterium]MBU1047100.1 4-hydroxy-3-methylbut-2-enyl diphosphate reductase [Candidatus Omnitrophota bacterium]MBU1631552.1 4-hydroxy-3-methylbut-2-enyl diphosphate reductase [Candidatus Omnitrophota bacterium]MBU1888766.1 4-hydroxy-3-methylbut-2-enyl diphosphate reductase [Candidatus Omnitrophota bacterium]